MSGYHLWSQVGFLLPLVRTILKFSVNWLTPIGLIKHIDKRLDPNRTYIEICHLASLILLVLILFNLRCPTPSWINILFIFISSWLLFDIIVAGIFLSFFRDENHSCPPRSLILLSINYVEIILILSIVNLACAQNILSICRSFQFSFVLFVPLAPKPTDYFAPLPIPYFLFVIEVLVSLIIHVTIIQRVLSYFTQKR